MTDSIISKNAFWARFTADEIAAVQNFPDAYNKINTSENTVDLLSPDIFAGVVDLGLLNILTKERARAILVDPIQESEQP